MSSKLTELLTVEFAKSPDFLIKGTTASLNSFIFFFNC